MGRGKLRMQLISNEKARRMAFEKRKKGLEKAANELSTLCGVDIGMIIYGPAQSNESNEPTIWPRNHEVVAGLIDSYKSRSDYDCRYRTYNLSAFFKDQTEKVEDELGKLRKKMREVKYPKWDDKFNCLSQDELKQFVSVLKAKIDAVRGRINVMKGSTSLFAESDVLMNPSVQESAVFMPSMWKFEQPDIVHQPQPLAYYDPQANLDNQRMMMMMNNGASCSQGTYSYDVNPGYCAYSFHGNQVQNCGFGTGIMENVGVSYHENPGNYAYSFDENRVQNCGFGTGIMENVGVSYHENPGNYAYSFDENGVQNCGFGTGIMENVGVSNGTYSFDENPNTYAYSFDENGVQNCGLGTGITENAGVSNAEPVRPYYVPNMVPMPQNEQCLLLSSAFPQMQAAQEGDCPMAWFFNEES
ncbi:hypothetical protein Pfo_025970 [Paulownia fortunei]|nr:hypothetical protein Pfo_025970 [Paulownia fortunei]